MWHHVTLKKQINCEWEEPHLCAIHWRRCHETKKYDVIERLWNTSESLVVLKAMFVQSVQDGYTFIVATMKYNVKLIDEVGDDVDDDI